MRARRLLFVLGLVTAAGFVSIFATFRAVAGGTPHRTAGAALRVVSSANFGPAALLPADVRALERFKQSGESLHDVTLVGTRAGRSYYRIENYAGAACYAVGPVHPTAYVLGQILCEPDFPSASRPVMDFTVMHGQPPQASRVWRSEGIAADGVVEIAFQTPDGRTVGATPVRDNIYSVEAAPTERVAHLIAKDASGTIVYSAPQ